MTEESENNKINLDLDFESIVPWNGQQDTGRDVRLKLDRNWQKVVDAFNALISFMVTADYLDEKYLRKDKPDTAQEIITFLKGLLIGENGSGFTVLADGTSQAVVDRLYVKIKAYFDALEVKKKTFVGGEQIISPAGMKCIRVETLDTVYRCYMKAEEEGVEIENEFVEGQLAICQECNIKVGISHHAGNRFYWREVMGIGADYIDLSRTICAADSDVPAPGDDIVGLGHRDDIARQSAIILSSVAETAPSIIFYQGIDDFILTGKEVIAFEYDRTSGHAKVRIYGDTYIGDKSRNSYIEFTRDKGVDIKGSFHIEKGSTGWRNFEGLPEEIKGAASGGSVGAVNLLRNSGFTGDYDSEAMSDALSLSVDSELYGRALKHWTGIASISADSGSVSGRSAVVGSLSQSVSLIEGENYVISFKAKGENVAVSCGDYSESQVLTAAYERYTFRFTHHGSGVFLLSGTATVCELQLERGSVRTDWKPSILDSDKAMAEFQSLRYLQDSIRNGSVDLLGGLILSNMIQLGNYKDGKMLQVNAGVSGIYNDGDDVAFWGGGTFEQAIRTIIKFKENPRYRPTVEEWSSLANFVVSHGGDVFMRGYIHALGGFFRGTVEIADGKILLNEDGSGQLANGTVSWTREGIWYRKSPEHISWVSLSEFPDKVITYEHGTYIDLYTYGLPPVDERTYTLGAAPDGFEIVLGYSVSASRYVVPAILSGSFRVQTSRYVTETYNSLTIKDAASSAGHEFRLRYTDGAWMVFGNCEVVDGLVVLQPDHENGTTNSAPSGLTEQVNVYDASGRHVMQFTDGLLTSYNYESTSN